MNHASFVFDYDGVRLICDPWLTGTAFNRGWRLLAPTTFAPADFATISHLWFSHQHPDHFSPADLRQISPEVRRSIEVLFQRTIDRKVVRYCTGLQFGKVTELERDRWYRLSPDLEILCNPWPDRDSWLALRTRAHTILNVNDCVIETPAEARAIAKCVGPVDVLFTQFSYANWAGNPGDAERHRREAARKLEQIRLQVEVFRPRYVVPFASFVWFSHVENFFHNAEMNQVGDVAAFIERDLHCEAIVLYPGERWSIGDTHASATAAERYATDVRAALENGPVDRAKTVPFERLERAMPRYLARIKRRNPVIGLIPGLRTAAYVTDYDRAFEFSLNGMRELPNGAQVDVHLGSESLLFALQAPWGANALSVNGRYVVPKNGDRARFFRFFRAGDYNDLGLVFDYRWAANQVASAVSRKLLTRTGAR
ncbi:MAG: MBL fold metallo-hydrolase [Vulcanimicrobiaceae bacterium]